MKNEYPFDEFYEDTWDYVSEMIVGSDFYFDNEECIREITFNLYSFYERKGKLSTKLEVAREAGKVLEMIFSPLNKYKLIETV